LLANAGTVESLSVYFRMPPVKYHHLFIQFGLDGMVTGNQASLKEFILLLKNEAKQMPGTGIISNQPQEVSDSEKEFTAQADELPTEIKWALLNLISVSSKRNSDMDAPAKTDEAGKSTTKKEYRKKTEVSKLFAEEEAMYIENAGIILLHPFLTPLFKELNLLNEQDIFLSDECRQRAIIILNYLCTGVETYDEHLLAFNKIICGLKPEDNLSTDLILTGIEKKECDHLLETVIQYWDALKGAGKEAIQETFFARKAKLSFNNNNYLLQVERMATDILIDRLPWGMGIVRLPWLDQLIYIEW
jgi:hypothetical protein